MRLWLLLSILLWLVILLLVWTHLPPPPTIRAEPPPQPSILEASPPPPSVERAPPLPQPDQDVQQLCLHILKEFSLPRDYLLPVYTLLMGESSRHDCDRIFCLFHRLPDLPLAKRLELGNHVVWHSHNQDHINIVYQYVMDMARDRRIDPVSRANAIDMLLRSNHPLYMQQAKRFLQELRGEEQMTRQRQLQQSMTALLSQTPQAVARHHFGMPQPRPQPLQLPLHLLRRRRPPPPTTPVQQQPPLDVQQEDIGIQQALYEQYRRLEREAQQQKKPTVYNDPQNVHNHAINESVIAGASLLVKKDNPSEPPPLNIEYELRRLCPQTERKWKKSLRRVRNDATKFKDGMTIQMVFDRVCHVIARSPHRQELLKRMAEELVDMEGLCSTGHMSRIMNIVQGFEDTPEELKIRLDPKEEVYASISTFFTKELQDADEQIMEDMMDPDLHKRRRYHDFMRRLVQQKRQELAQSYRGIVPPHELDNYMEDAVKKFAANDQDSAAILA